MGNILYNQKNIFEAITIVLNVPFVQLIPGVQRFSIGTAQLFFCSCTILSRNHSFTYVVLVGSAVNKSHCTCREIIEYYFDCGIPFLNCHMRNCTNKLFFRNCSLRDVFYIWKILRNMGATWNLCFQGGKLCMEF